MKAVRWLSVAALWVSAAWPQSGALLSTRDALALYGRSVQLMESTSVAVPELARAGAPVIENARQAVVTLRTGAVTNHAGLTYTFLMNLRAYVALADAVPKPYPFPAEPQKQFIELRDDLNRAEAHFRALLDQKETLLRNPDRDNLKRYAEANLKVGPPQPGRPRVVFLGDSITDGWRLNEYFPDHDFVNRGISGQITGEMLGRMKADVIDLKPEMMVVLAGTNDLARGVDVKVIENNLTMIAELAQVHKIKPLFASLLPVSDYHRDRNPQYEQTRRRPPQKIGEINNWLALYCRQHNYGYVDYYSVTVDRAGAFRTDLSDDGLHPNSAGYRVMAPVVLAAIQGGSRPAAEPKAKKRRFGL
jgi:lysophospholipase L1-like esterase